jgi:hypothetical protein
VTTLWSSVGIAAAGVALTELGGKQRDPRGDASVSPFTGPPAADIKRVTARYDPVEGRFALEATLYRPVPSEYRLKTLFVSPQCRGTTTDVLDYDTGGSAILRINGQIPLSLAYTLTREGSRLTETWSGPELRQLAGLGCVRGAVATGGIGGFGLDEFGPFPLR